MLKLNRNFLFSCLLVTGVALAGLGWFLRDLAWQELTRNEFQANEHLSRMLGNSLWPSFNNYILTTRQVAELDAMQSTTRQRLTISVQRQIQNLNIVKVHVFNTQGLIIFSTNPEQLNSDQSGNPGVLAALKGQSHSTLKFKEHIDHYHKTLHNRNVIASYVPIMIPGTQQVGGVIEVYLDVTSLVNSLESSLQKSIIAVCVCLMALYAYLFWIVRRNDRLIQSSRQQIKHMAYHDSLTGLPNRRQLTETLLERLEQKHLCHGVLFIDLDGFKPINDELGHKTGDDLLKAAAKRLTLCLSNSDIAARIGGDEFVILISPDLPVESMPFQNKVITLAEQIRSTLDQPFEHKSGPLHVTASIGISLSPVHSRDATDLLRKADMAMYSAKQKGRNQIVLFQEGICQTDRGLSWHH